jgi:predicted DNA-binding WGR domain protein
MSSNNGIPNANGELLIENFAEPFYLHHEFKKFWEISLIDRSTTIRYGKLLEGGVEDLNKTNEQTKEHEDQKAAKEYLKCLITQKRLKGYDFLKVQSKKRKIENFDVDLPKKQIKTNENDYQVVIYLIKTLKILID